MKNFDKDAALIALQNEVDTLRTILAMMPGHLYWRNKEGYYLGCNTNIANIINYESVDELIGKRPVDFMSVELATQVDKIDFEVINTEKEQSIEEQGYSSDGTAAIYLTRKSPFYDREGRVQGVLGISFDITERKVIEEKLKIAKEKAETANRAKSQFLAMISHELRTPLTSIIGFANFIRQGHVDPEKKEEYVTHILNSGSYLLSLINSLLDYNKLENNKFELIDYPVNFKTLAEDVITMLSASAELKQLSLLLDFDDSIPDYLLTDEKIFLQILINLIGNAIKFTENGNITLRMKCLTLKKKTATLQIAVEDTGIGIPEEEQQAIFRRFYQLENVYTRNESLTGTGLGLAIVKKLVHLLGGKMQVTSELNKGSNFYFNVTLPITSAPVSHSDTIKKPSKRVAVNPNVLLIEDDALIQIIHKQMLEELHCKVDVTDSAKKALQMLSDKYDILFVDIGLPDITGFELIKRIRQINKKMEQIPIVVLTGYSDENEYQRCIQAGANQVAIKPVSIETLREIISSA
jgi:two-component system aerobic respiration control sensor histidine kinase ArcB